MLYFLLEQKLEKLKYLGQKEVQYYRCYPSDNSRMRDCKSKQSMMTADPWFIITKLKKN